MFNDIVYQQICWIFYSHHPWNS